MKKYFEIWGRHTKPCLALLLALFMVLCALPVLAEGDVYDNALTTYRYNNRCHGFYLEPKEDGKYQTVIMIHGQGGARDFQPNYASYINDWVTAGYFPPMVVIIPEVDNDKGAYLDINDFQDFIKLPARFKTLVDNIQDGNLSAKCDTTKDIIVCGFSMGGMAAVQAGAEHNDIIKRCGGLSPSQSFYLGEGAGGYYNHASDIYFSQDDDAYLYMSSGQGEGAFGETVERYKTAIESTGNNKEGLITTYSCPESWGRHSAQLCQKEVFMFLYFNAHGELPSESLVEAACNCYSAQAPAIITQESIYDQAELNIPTALIDLDVSGYTKDTTTKPNTTSASIGGVVNNGSQGTATRTVFSNYDTTNEQSLSLKSFQNSAGESRNYLSFTKNSTLVQNNNIYRFIEDNILETQANTISFWVKLEPQTERRAIFNYALQYQGEDKPINVLRLCANSSKTTLALCNGWDSDSPSGENINDTNGKWAQYVIVNPEYNNGEKKVKVYVNGDQIMSKTIEKHVAALQSARLYFAGEGDGMHSICYPDDISFADIKVYSDALTSAQVYKLYKATKDAFDEEGVPQPETIEGYTFKNASFEYDGENHTIEVEAAANATEGVAVSYTVNGSEFTGATEVGTYSVKATLTKEGFEDLVLNATLTITPKAAEPVDEGEILVDFDLSNFTPGSMEGASGIVNKGVSETTEITAHSSATVKLTSDFIYNKDDLSVSKKVLRVNHNIPAGGTGNSFKIKDPAFETQDITLSFWTNLDPISKQTPGNSYQAIAQYNAKRDDGTFKDGSSNSRGRLWQATLETNKESGYYWSDNWTTNMFFIGTSKQWHHVVMTIPQFVSGAKTVKVYVDGELELTENLSLGGKTLQDSWISLGCDENGGYIPGDISFGDVKVYAGALSDAAIANIYNAEKDVYDNAAYNKITVKNSSGAEINKLTDIAEGSAVTVSCEKNSSADEFVFAAVYDESGSFLSAGTGIVGESGSFEVTLPAGFNSLKIYTFKSNLEASQKYTVLYK